MCQKLWKLGDSRQSYCKNSLAYLFWPTPYFRWQTIARSFQTRAKISRVGHRPMPTDFFQGGLPPRAGAPGRPDTPRDFILSNAAMSDMPSRRRLRSSLTHQLDVRQSQCATVGDRTFATAGARLWNSLPANIVSCDTLPHFRRELKTCLFRQSSPRRILL